jgi:hypothetical protein
MKKYFRGYYHLSTEEFKLLWEKCIFIFDTNVLLNLYRYPRDVSDDIISVLKSLKERIWVPHFVVLEYQENRISVIQDQEAKFDEVKSDISKFQNNLDGKFRSLEKRHSTIDPLEFLDQAQTIFSEFGEQVERYKEELPNLLEEDHIRDELDTIFNDNIGGPFSDDQLKILYEEGSKRYEKEIPPGYKDRKNKDGERFSYNGSVFENKYGDLIIWKQIIEEAKANDTLEYLIFVTDDDKEDWWWREKGKTIGPRPELVEEILVSSNIKLFYMYNSNRFLELAKDQLEIDIHEETIKEVRNISQELRTERFSPYLRRIIEYLWNNSNPISVTPSDILQNIGAGAYGNHSKLSLAPWGLVDNDPETSKRTITTKGIQFAKGEIEIPLIIYRDPESLEWVVDPEAEMILITDVGN